MRLVWFAFKLLEAFLGLICLAIHIDGFLRVSVDNFLMFLVVFVLFPLMAMFDCLNICMNWTPTARWEAGINTFATICYVYISLATMYYTEKEIYLMYLSELEDPLHPFFQYSKAQSIATLFVGVVHMLHAVFAFDVLIQPKHSYADPSEEPLQLYLFGKTVQTHLETYVWFRRLADRLQPGDVA